MLLNLSIGTMIVKKKLSFFAGIVFFFILYIKSNTHIMTGIIIEVFLSAVLIYHVLHCKSQIGILLSNICSYIMLQKLNERRSSRVNEHNRAHEVYFCN